MGLLSLTPHKRVETHPSNNNVEMSGEEEDEEEEVGPFMM